MICSRCLRSAMSRTTSTLAWLLEVWAVMFSNVALGVADHAGNALQHAEAVVAEDSEFHGIGCRSAVVAGPLDVNAALGLVEKIGHVGATDRVHSHALAARDVADDAFAADRITTSGAVDQHIALSTDGDSVVVAETHGAPRWRCRRVARSSPQTRYRRQ